MDLSTLCTLTEFLQDPIVRGGEPYIETLCRSEWGAAKKAFIGDREDLQQTLVVALLEWHRDLGKPERFEFDKAADHLKRHLARTIRNNRRRECQFPATLIGADGEAESWNPVDTFSTLSEERIRALCGLVDATGKFSGAVAAFVLRGRILHDLSWEQISKRLRHYYPLKGEPTDCSERVRQGYNIDLAVKLSPKEVETLYHDTVAKLREKARSGEWGMYNKYDET